MTGSDVAGDTYEQNFQSVRLQMSRPFAYDSDGAAL